MNACRNVHISYKQQPKAQTSDWKIERTENINQKSISTIIDVANAKRITENQSNDWQHLLTTKNITVLPGKNKSSLDIVIVHVRVDFNRTVVCDSDCHFTNLCGDEPQSHVMLEIFLSWTCYCNSDSCKTVKKVSTNQTEKQLSTNGYNISHYQTDNSPFFRTWNPIHMITLWNSKVFLTLWL